VSTSIKFLAVSSVLGAALVLAPGTANATDYNFACNDISNLDGFEPCIADRWDVSPGQFLRVLNVSAGGKSVKFKAYNVSGHHLLGTSVNLKVGSTGLLWRNDTSSTIKVDVEADPDACCVTVNVAARASITSS
jgi:hypothetical protein